MANIFMFPIITLCMFACFTQLFVMDESETTPVIQADAARLAQAGSSVTVLKIKHHKTECEGSQVTHCLLVREGDDSLWSYLYSEIEGLEYQWGVEYEILVEKNGPDYRLVEILSTSEYHSGTDFNYTIRGHHQGIERVGDSEFLLHGEKRVECAPQVCSTLISMLEQQQMVLLNLAHTHPDSPLVLANVVCGDAPNSYGNTCGFPVYPVDEPGSTS